MSFILDALKKAESERSRSSGPVLMDVRVAPPRRRLPTWAWVLGLVLAANLGVLAWLLLRTPPAAGGAGDEQRVPPPAVNLPAAGANPPAPAPATPPPAAGNAPLPTAANAAPPPPNLDSLPTLQDLTAAGTVLPPLQLNLHVYDALPANRYVLLNSARLREGEYTADGVKVEAITPQGVVLDAAGRRFRLLAGG
jgi:general secretion pathway protein B